MSTLLKRVKSMLLCVVMLFSLIPTAIYADDALTVRAENKQIELSTDATVTIDLIVDNNPGIIAMGLDVSFDKNNLEYVDVTDGFLSSDCFTLTKPNVKNVNNKGIIPLNWDSVNDTDDVNTGTVATITFKVKDGAVVGKYDIGVTVMGKDEDNILNISDQSVALSATAGSVTIYSILSEVALSGSITTPVRKQSDASEITGNGVNAAVTWEPALTDGRFASSTAYTATVKVTAKDGYQFADETVVSGVEGLSFIKQEDGSYSASKTFPATAARTLESITVTTAPNKTAYEVGNNFEADGMVVSAHYDEGEDDANYTNYVVQGGTDLAYGTYPVTIVSNDDSNVTATTYITVSKKNLTGDDFEYTDGTVTYDGTDHASTAKNIQGFQEGLMDSLTFIFKVGDNVVQELINAGVYTVYVSTEEGTMYNAMGQTEVGTFTINKANATLTAPTAKELTYNGQAQALVNDGAATGGELQYKLGADGTYSTSVATATDAGTYTVYYKVEGDDNHNDVAETSVSVTIAKAAITPTVSIEGWTYGETAKTPDVNGNSGKGTVTYRYAVKGTTAFSETVRTDAGDYTVKATIAETANYLGGEATADFTIAKANASVNTAPTAKELTYDGSAKALVNEGTAQGGELQYKLGADGTYSTTIPTATNAGTYTVYYKVKGDSNHNDVAENSVEVTINKQPVDVSKLTWQTADSFSYDGQLKTVTLSSAIPQGLTANYENNTATYVGEYTATVSFTADDNHEVSGTPATFSWKINPVANPITITKDSYNLAKGGNTLDLATLIQNAEGTVTFSIESGNAATLDGSVLTSGADSSATPVVIGIHVDAVYKNNDATPEFNAYDNASAITVTVVDKEQKTLTVTMGDWTYGDNAKSPAFTAPAGSAAPVITYTGKNYSAPTDAGTYTVQVVCETATEIYTGSDEFTINPKTASITWSNTSFTYDGQSHVPTATVSNKVGQDSVPVTVSGAATAAGSYTATATGLDNANYALPTVAPTRSFTIAQRTAELNWSNTSFTYDGQSHQPTATVTNAVDGDTVTVTVSGGKTNAGSYTATAASLSNANYALPTAKTQSFTINKRVAELNWTNTSFTYDGKSHQPTATVTNAVEGDTVTVTVTGGKTNAGSYTATATKVSNSNYALPDTTGCDFTIAPKNISDMTVNLSAAALTYNGKAQTKAVASVRDGSTTLSSGRDYTVSGATQTNAGHYELTVTGTGNYTGSKTVAWEIAPKAVTVTANNATKVYGADDPALTAKVSGTVGSDTVAYTVSRAKGNDVGTYTITPAGDENQGNYTVTFKTGTFTITKANASVTSAPQAVTDLVFNGQAQDLITAGKADGGELQYKLGNGAYGTAIPTATEAGTYSVYYKVVGDKNHNSVSEARITVTIAPLSGNAVVTDGEVTASTEPDDTINSQLFGLEQYQTEALGLEENPTPEQVAAARLEAIRKDMTKAAGTSATNASALYYVDASSAAKVTFALPVSAATHNFKVMYMATNGVISPVTNAKVTASGIEVPVAADGDGVYLVTYTNKPVSVDVDDDDTVKSAGTGDMGLVLYTVLAVSGATGAAWLGLKKRKED